MDVIILKINFENNKRNRTSLALLYLVIFFVVSTYLLKRNFIDFNTIRSLYMPIVGISMLAIMLDYLIFGHIFLVVSSYALISKLVNDTANINIIIIFGLVLAFLLQMYVKLKNKKK